jgi:hypothetical protein
MVDIVIHEIGAPVGKITRQLVILERQLAKMLSLVQISEVAPSISSIRGWIEQIHALRQRLDPQTPGRRGRATVFDVGDAVWAQRTATQFRAILFDKTEWHWSWPIHLPAGHRAVRAADIPRGR